MKSQRLRASNSGESKATTRARARHTNDYCSCDAGVGTTAFRDIVGSLCCRFRRYRCATKAERASSGAPPLCQQSWLLLYLSNVVAKAFAFVACAPDSLSCVMPLK